MTRQLLFIVSVLIGGRAFAQDSVRISGKIQNPLSDSLEVSFNDNRIAYYPQEYYTHVDKKGNFRIAFPVRAAEYTQVEVRHGDHIAELIVTNGDSLVMTVNATRFDSSVKYGGKGGEIENYVAQHTIALGRMNRYTLKVKEDINKGPADFSKAIDKEKNVELDFLKKNKAHLPAAFIKYWTAYYTYYNYFFIEQYPQIHEAIKLRRFTDTIPDTNYMVLKDLPYAFNDTLLQLPPYLLYLTGVIEIKLKAAGYNYMQDTAKMRLFQDSVYTLVNKVMPDKSAEYYMAQNLYGKAKNQPIEKTGAQVKDFRKRWPQSQYLPLIEKQVAIAQRLAPGQPAPDFDIATPDGKTRKLSDLKGKVVYLDFWAGWCKQCVGEILAEKKIKDLIKNKPLEFVYVSLGNDTTIENGMIAKYKMSGLFTQAWGGWNAKEVQQYGIQSLPTYFLIDEEGKFAVQNPPSPMKATLLILAIEQLFK